MAILFVTDGDWGTGLGEPLTAAQADNNIWELLERIAAIEADPPEPLGIETIELVGSSLVVTMTDGTTQFGPFPLPVASIEYVGEWVNNGVYQQNDIISVADVGVFLVLQDHVAPDVPAEFDPDATAGSNALYRQIFGVPKIVRQPLATNYLGPLPGDSQIITQYLIQQSILLPTDLDASGSRLGDAATAEVVITLWKNDTQIGSITHIDGDGGLEGTFDFPADVTFEPGDLLIFKAPATADASAGNWSATLVATIQD